MGGVCSAGSLRGSDHLHEWPIQHPPHNPGKPLEKVKKNQLKVNVQMQLA
jgi:hypothetical protein